MVLRRSRFDDAALFLPVIPRVQTGDDVRAAFWTFGLAGFLLLGAAAIAILRGDGSYGISRFWQVLAGPPDLGPVDFSAVRRSPTGNDALICPPDVCGTAAVDATSPVFLVPAGRLRDAVRIIEVNDPDVDLLARDEAKMQDRYLVRTRMMRFPDTVSVRFIELDANRSTLALYSRSQLGARDFGVNRARLEQWLTQLRAQLPAAP